MKRPISLILAIAMVFSMLAQPVQAAEVEEVVPPVEAVEELPVLPGADEEIVLPPAEETPAEEAPVEETVPEEESAPEESAPEAAEPEEAPAPFEEEMDAEEADTAEEASAEEAADELVNAAYTTNADKRLITLTSAAGSDIKSALSSAITAANKSATASAIWTVKVPAGSYKLSGSVRLKSNVKLELTGATIKYTASGSYLFFTTGVNGGYTDFQNITIKGGTLQGSASSVNTMVHIAHATNVTLDGVTFTDCAACHELEVAGIKNLTVQNCKFRNLTAVKSPNGGGEAIQMDILVNDDVFADKVYDGTPMQNVTIYNCTFENTPRGIGCHNQLLGSYHKTLNISECTFSNLGDAAMFLVGFRDCDIRANLIKNCTQGIYLAMIRNNGQKVYTTMGGTVYAAGTTISDADSTIVGNTISVKLMDKKRCTAVAGIYLFGQKYTADKSASSGVISSGTYNISAVSVNNNDISVNGTGAGSAYGVHLSQATDCQITDNAIACTSTAGHSGIFLEQTSVNDDIVANDIRNFPQNGIYLKSSEATILHNDITGCKKYGIALESGCAADSINGNTIRSTGNNGIYATGATLGTVSKNDIKTTGQYGIYVNSPKKAVSINENTISGTANHPIRVSAAVANTLTINKNKLTAKSGKYGILADKGTLSVANNTFSGGKYAVCTASGVKGGIYFNTLNSSLKYYIKGSKAVSAGNSATVTLSSVKKKASGSLTASWKKVTNASGYVVQYSANSDMSSPKSVTVSSGSTVTKTISSLTAGKKYYVRVRSYRTCNSIKIYSKYSAVKNVTV